MNTNITLAIVLTDELSETYRDKVFWFASKVEINDKSNTVDIYIDSQNCLVAFDDVAEQLNMNSIAKISKLGGDTTIGNHPVLVSSGAFLWINNNLLVTQRTADTKYDPLHWTTPAGRCDLLPLQTGYKEASEEITGYSKATNKIWMPKPTLTYLNDINAHGYEVIESFPKDIKVDTSTVQTWIDGELVETAEMWFYYSPDVNTLELRVPMYAETKEEFYFKNNEFETNVGLKSIDELKNMDVVPAVAKLIEEIGDENPDRHHQSST